MEQLDVNGIQGIQLDEFQYDKARQLLRDMSTELANVCKCHTKLRWDQIWQRMDVNHTGTLTRYVS